jgi:tartrate dehydrogenase/decarboxylase / D-malate dehydrogenase
VVANGSSPALERVQLRAMIDTATTVLVPVSAPATAAPIPRHRRIAVIAGDGIGREVMPVALDVVRAAARDEVEIETVAFPWSCDFYLETGAMMPADALDTLRAFDAIFLGAIGDPSRVPDTTSLWGSLLKIRKGLNLAVNVRPARFLPGMPSPLIDPNGFDVVVARENTEGEYSDVGGRIHQGDREIAIQVNVFTRQGTTAVVRYALDLARTRRGRLTSATKSNGIMHAMPFWDEVVRDVAADYPDVAVESMHLDALLARLVRDPARFDVIVGSNLFGDLLTDLSAALMGSIGIAPSANIDPTGVSPSLFEPVHGSAPDIAGRGIANPIGQVWTGALMLRHLGYPVAADRIEAAIAASIVEGELTPDMGGTLSTTEVGVRLVARIEAGAR